LNEQDGMLGESNFLFNPECLLAEKFPFLAFQAVRLLYVSGQFQDPISSMSQPTVAVIGASHDRRKFGNKAVRAYIESGYTVFPVNPREETVEGLKAYHSVDEIPEPVEIVSLYVPPAVGLKMLEAIAQLKPQEVWLNPGSESDELIEAAADLHLRTVVACSISALGVDPGMIPDA
jgi:uncharacterized protein